ncbi:MAG: FumA C-terminus/TtdB family hydratase beta subunit [Planctomycetota bacterium]|nr:FumA C-terminus/TtdB family hydratase beta subunit [Planctomycetota bacterium]
MNWDTFRTNMLELIRRTSAYLPQDIDQVIQTQRLLEQTDYKADFALDLVQQNIGLARAKSLPICQDTGTINFFIHTPKDVDQVQMAVIIREAIVLATEKGYLRQNSVDSITGANSGNNLGPGSPVIHWEQTTDPHIDVRLVLKGGGCENMSAQYSLPTDLQGKTANRSLEGVRACILDAVWRAQGKGCGPGFLGVCIGGDRASGYEVAKRQLLRLADDVNPDTRLADLENQIMQQANQLGIGPMGFSGKFTVGGCKIGAVNRLPASFFVTIAYMCWAYRRRGVVLDRSGSVVHWLYQDPQEDFSESAEVPTLTIPGGNLVRLQTPLTESQVRDLKAGDVVLISGVVRTARDAVHKYLFEGGELDGLEGGIIYHCGPVVISDQQGYRVLAAGPTTSIREEPYQAEIIRRFGVRAVIGKGGMGEKTRQACQEFGCVYLHGIGGAAQVYAMCVERVLGVSLEQFGSPEAVWELQVKDMPAIVTIDAHGKSLHDEVAAGSKASLAAIEA